MSAAAAVGPIRPAARVTRAARRSCDRRPASATSDRLGRAVRTVGPFYADLRPFQGTASLAQAMTLAPVTSDAPVYSIVIPVFNEEGCLPELFDRMQALLDRLDGTAELIFVDDGSSDASYPLLVGMSARDPRCKVLRLSRNFGHQLAITAGVDHAAGDAVIVMDADLQDPPEVALEMVERWREGFHIVYGIRARREGDTRFKRFTAALFYRLFRRLAHTSAPSDAGDFRLVDRKALRAFRAMREHNRYVRGMFAWIGFRQTGVSYVREQRFAGRTKYPLRRMMKFAIDAIISFSNAPLRLALNLGFVVSILSFLAGIAAAIAKLGGAYAVPGWASIIVVVSFLGGVQLIVLGMMGEYLARVYDEVKERPLYVVMEQQGDFSSLEATVLAGESGDGATVPRRPSRTDYR